MIRKLQKDEFRQAADLSLEVFMQTGKADFNNDGLETFKSFVKNEELMNELVIYGAFEKDELAGIIGTKQLGTHISLFFIRTDYRNKGIGRNLFDFAILDNPVQEMTVNSSTYAVDIYQSFGFIQVKELQETNGLKYIPMKRILNKINIRQIHSDKKRFIDLLLLADEQESMIDRYLERGEMFVLSEHDTTIASCVVTDEGYDTFEIKNIATDPRYHRKGYGTILIDFITGHYRDRGNLLFVGTGDSPNSIPFYQHCGFSYSHRIPGFFTTHYDHPIFDEGIQLIDMVYLKKSLRVISRPTSDDFDELLLLWEASVRSTHHFLTEEDVQFYKQLIPQYFSAVELYIIRNKQGAIAAFMGLSDEQIEMLFVHPQEQGKGFGKQLLLYAIQEKEIHKVDVNEQNEEAHLFYQHMGFQVISRDETDPSGKPFPILHLALIP